MIGCDNVEVNAPILDTLGVNLSPSGNSDPKVKPRGDLVVPPTKTLPNPDQMAAAKAEKTQSNELWPDDPDARRKRLAVAKKEEKRREREEIDFEKGDIDEFRKIEGQETTGTGLLDNLFGRSDDSEEE